MPEDAGCYLHAVYFTFKLHLGVLFPDWEIGKGIFCLSFYYCSPT